MVYLAFLLQDLLFGYGFRPFFLSKLPEILFTEFYQKPRKFYLVYIAGIHFVNLGVGVEISEVQYVVSGANIKILYNGGLGIFFEDDRGKMRSFSGIIADPPVSADIILVETPYQVLFQFQGFKTGRHLNGNLAGIATYPVKVADGFVYIGFSE